MGRLSFLLSATRKIVSRQDTRCPNCGGLTKLLGGKRLVLQLRKCLVCQLMFRYPKDDATDNAAFYQSAYRDPTATDLPDPADLPTHIATNFASIARDLTPHIELIRTLTKSGRVLDYGCSWGYGPYQLQGAGYEVLGYEISAPRAEYGRRHLSVDITPSLDAVPSGSFDVIYSAHVLEHIPDPKIAFRDFQRLLKRDGVLVLYVPNAGSNAARRLGTAWGPMIGEKHVLALTAEFFERNLTPYGFRLLFNSAPYDEPARPLSESPPLEGEELLVIGRRS